MKKILKIVLKVLACLLLLVLLAVLTLPLWVSPVACGVANSVVPSKLSTGFHLGQCNVNPYNGKVTVGDLQLFNPPGYSQKMAFTLARLHVNVDMSTVMSDTLVVEDIDISEVFVSYVKNDLGENNFDVILRNVNGQSPKPEAEVSEPATETEEKADVPVEPKAETTEGEKKSRKIIIDRLHIEKVLVQWGPLTLPLPAITLTGIGRSSGGMSFENATEEIRKQVMARMDALGAGLSNLGDVANGLSKKGAEHLDHATKAVKGVTDNAAGAVESLKNAADAAKNVKDGAADALKSIKGLFE